MGTGSRPAGVCARLRPAGAVAPGAVAPGALAPGRLAAAVAPVAAVAAFPVAEMAKILAGPHHVVLYGDQALIAMAARRAGQFHQLLGPYSRAGFHHPGPVLFYLLAPFVGRLGPSGAGLYLGALTINLAAMVASVILLRRRMGPAAAVWAAVALDVFVVCLGPGTLREPWNPYLVILPMALFLLLWAAARDGSRASCLWAMVVGSYLVQTHIATAAVVAVLLAALAFRRRPGRQTQPPSAPQRAAPQRTAPQRAASRAGAVVALVALGAMWLPSLIELAVDHPNNGQRLWHFFAGAHPHADIGQMLRTAADALTVIPFGNRDYVLARHHGWPEVVAAGAATVTLAWWARRRAARRDLTYPVALIDGAAAAGLIGVASLAGSDGPVNLYFALWLSVVPLMVLIAAGAAAAPAPTAPTAAVAAAAAAAAIAVLVSGWGLPPLDRTVGSGPWPAADNISPAARAQTVTTTAILGGAAVRSLEPGDRAATITIGSPALWPYAAGVAWDLDQRHIAVDVGPPPWSGYFDGGGEESVAAPTASPQLGLYPASYRDLPAGTTVIATAGGAVLTYRRGAG